MKFFWTVGLIYLSLLGWMCNGWFMIWMLMEISFGIFMGMLSLNKSYGVVESSMKYFIIQVSFSLVFLTGLIWHVVNLFNYLHYVCLVILSVKLGLIPVHFWIISVVGKMNWVSFLMVGSFIKLMPLILVYYSIKMLDFSIILWLNVFGGSLGGLNNVSIQKMLSFSSVVNLTWMIVSLFTSYNLFFFFFLGYLVILCFLVYMFSQMNIFYVSQFNLKFLYFGNKVLVLFSLLSLSGFPPFLGFLMKLGVIWSFSVESLKFLLVFMVCMGVFSTFFYFQLYFFVLLIYSLGLKWYNPKTAGFGGFMFLVMCGYLVLFLIY